MIVKPPIWEPKGTSFRPYDLSTLISFYVGRFLARMFKGLFGR